MSTVDTRSGLGTSGAVVGGRRLSPPAVAARLGWSEGDLWTVGLGLALALVLALSTIPAVLDARGGAPRAANPVAAPPAAPAPAPVPVPPPVVVAPPAPGQAPAPLPVAPAPPAGPVDEPAPPPAPPAAPAGARPPAPGEVRRFADVPGGAAPGAVAAGADGRVLAGTDEPAQPGEPARLLTWGAGGTLESSVPVPGQPGNRARGLTAVTSLPVGGLAAVDAATSRLLRYDGRAWSTTATVPDVPACLGVRPPPCQPGVLDTPPLLRGVALGPSGDLFVSDGGQGALWRVPPGGQIELWYASADLVGRDGAAGLAVDADGHLRVVVTRLADVQGTGAGALLRIERTADGDAGARTAVAGFRPGEDPVDVALGASGSAYVVLRGVDAVVTLDRAGVEQLRVVDEGMQGPTAVDVADRRLLVAVTGPTPGVVEIGVRDTPLVPRPTPQQEVPDSG